MHIAALPLLVAALVPLSLGHASRRGHMSSTLFNRDGTLDNGTSYNGTSYNGTYYNGTSYNSTSYNSSSSFNASGETYSAPLATGGVAWKDAYARAQALVAQMTLEEKASFITGHAGRCAGNTGSVERLGIPILCLQDGPAGVRPVQGSSQFPAGQAVAATWDRELFYARGHAMGQEFYDQGVHIALSPVTGGPLGRAPRDGRLWEGFFADAYGTGEAAYHTVKGLQDAGTMATAKHLIGYEQETFRNPYNALLDLQLPISSNIDDEATHELYLWGFAEAVRVGVSFVMCSYNMVNNTHACANSYTQNHLLKEELNFQGGIVSDWGAVWGTTEFINGGLDMSMPGSADLDIFGLWWGDELVLAVVFGLVEESRVDDAVTRVLTPWIASGQADNPPPAVTWNTESILYDANSSYWHDVRQRSTSKLIRQIGAESVTLLKNTNNALPLNEPGVLVMVGSDAGSNTLSPLNALGLETYLLGSIDGTITLGGGSGWAIPPYVVTPYEAINYRAREQGAQVYSIFSDSDLIDVAVTAASAEVAIVFVRAFRKESTDISSLGLDNYGELLIDAVTAVCNNTIVVIHAGGPVLVESWIDNPSVTAVVLAHYPGEESGNGLADVLFGDVSPSGKLPYTIAHSEDDYPPNTIVDTPVINPQSDFTESTLIDYRWFSAHNTTPRFEFGFGLSYSTFAYSNVSVASVLIPDNTTIQTTNEPFEGATGNNSLYDVIAQVTAQVTNTGNVTASEVAQLYATIPGSEGIWLRGFDKLKLLSPGETRTATFQLRRKDLSLWDTEEQLWYIPDGDIQLQVGASSTKLYLTTAWSQSQ